MFEPLSALAVLGFTTGALGFIVSTTSKLDEKTLEIRECETRLGEFRRQLRYAYMQLKAWQSIWIGNKAFPHETYVHFWGTEGLEDIESRVKGITALSNQIRNLLYHPHKHEPGISLPTTADWHLLTDEEVEQLIPRRDMYYIKDTLACRINFALFLNAELVEKISRLKSHIEELRDITQWSFRLEQHGDPNKQVTSAELRRISDMKSFVYRAFHFGNLLHANLSYLCRSEWAIELTPPDSGHTMDFWSEVDTDTIYIDFFVRDAAHDVQHNAIRLRLYVKDYGAHRNLSRHIMGRIGEILLDHQKFERDSECDQFFRLLGRPSRRSRSLRQMLAEDNFSGSHRKDFEAERVDLVYGLGHWMVLLCKTPWANGLCTCKIRCICLVDGGIRHAFFPSTEATEAFHTPRCCHRDLMMDRFRLLGVALAEVALAFPIEVLKQEKFVVCGEIASWKRLIGMLSEKFGRGTITKAVSYCLDPDLADVRGSLRPEYFDQYCQNIVLPYNISQCQPESAYFG